MDERTEPSLLFLNQLIFKSEPFRQWRCINSMAGWHHQSITSKSCRSSPLHHLLRLMLSRLSFDPPGKKKASSVISDLLYLLSHPDHHILWYLSSKSPVLKEVKHYFISLWDRCFCIIAWLISQLDLNIFHLVRCENINRNHRSAIHIAVSSWLWDAGTILIPKMCGML